MSSESEQVDFWEVVEKIRERDKRFAPEAYALVMEALEFAIQRIGERRHVNAAELLVHFCDYAKESYGVMAYSILEKWGVRTTGDVGSIVYRLIDERVLAEQEGDSPADFSGVFELRTRLEDNYFQKLGKEIRRNPPPG